MRYIVAQTGARRGYAVPSILHRAGLLEFFCTDICADVGLGRWLAMLVREGASAAELERLASRRLPAGLAEKTRTADWPLLLGNVRVRMAGKDGHDQFRETIRMHEHAGRSFARRGFGQATHLYMMLNEFPTLLNAAKQAGLRTVSETYIVPSADRIVREERELFPDWDPVVKDLSRVRREFCKDELQVTSIDHFICPSEAVRADLMQNHGVATERISVVPYGFDDALLQERPMTRPGTILFAGTADLRKGIHYFAMAADSLRRDGHRYEFIVAGHVTEAVRARPPCKALRFLGRVPRSEMRTLLRQADVFVLPSLAEGSAEAIFEALACGVPVVTTAASGSVVRDGLDGHIVPERDAQAIAEAIHEIVSDRSLREAMSASARVQASHYTWDHYGTRLLSALKAVA